jgi:hypothetical protein
MAEKLLIMAVMIDSPGGKRRRRIMVRPTVPRGAPRTIVLPDSLNHTQKTITDYIGAETGTLKDNIEWFHPLRT